MLVRNATAPDTNADGCFFNGCRMFNSTIGTTCYQIIYYKLTKIN